MNDDVASARFFLAEVAAMLADPRPENRRIALGTDPAPASKTVAAFLLTGPATIDASNTEEWLYDRWVKDSTVKGRDFLTSALRTVTPAPAKDLIYLGAGPGRYVVVTALPKAPDKVTTYTLTDARSALGSGWTLAPVFSAVSLPALIALLDEEGTAPDEPLGMRVLAGAAITAERTDR